MIVDGKTPVKTSGSGDLLCVLTEIYSNSIAGELKKINKSDQLSHLRATGFCSTPEFTRSTKKSIYVFVNNRVVKCPVILKAIDTAYKNMLPAGKYPFVCLNLEIPAKDVDVNVHPTKKEVRYQNPNQIFNFVYSAVTDALSAIRQPAFVQNSDVVLPFGNYSKTGFPADSDRQEIEVNQDEKDEDTVYVSSENFEKIYNRNTQQNTAAQTEPLSGKERPFELNVRQIDLDIPKTAQIEETINIIGQYRNTYIIFEEDTELKIVDQHIADERYIFEKLQENLKNNDIPSQLLLISDVLHVETADMALLMENTEKLKQFGYEIQQISQNEITFKKVPQVISHIKVKDILSDILENLQGDLNNLEEKMLVTMSCKAAVKAGAELNLWQMEELIKKWKTTKMPYTCPHGRPIVHSFSEKEIASFFHRSV